MGKFVSIIAVISCLITAFIYYEWVNNAKDTPNFSKYHNLNERKEAFIKYLYPRVDMVLQDITARRNHIEKLYNQFLDGEDLGVEDIKWLTVMTFEYGLEGQDVNSFFTWNELRIRVDTIPPSMVIAQAALESAWGSSRFAIEGKNLFGQQCYSDGCGMLPSKRSPGRKHEVRIFNNFSESIKAYINNLNVHEAYAMFRANRMHNRINGKSLNGADLSTRLGKYSEIGDEYSRIIKKIIAQNNLAKYDTMLEDVKYHSLSPRLYD